MNSFLPQTRARSCPGRCWHTDYGTRLRAWCGILIIASSLALTPQTAGADSATANTSTPRALFTRKDAWFGAAALTGIVVAGFADHRIGEHAPTFGGRGADRLSSNVQWLGTPQVLAPGVVIGMVAGKLLNRPEVTRASVHIAAAVVVAGAADVALKWCVGRARPDHSPNDPFDFQPFSGPDAFPSGHTTVAFAAATALDGETSARWIPWVGYPLATLVGWSRVHDNRHWTSDVVGGAALGYWTARKVVAFTHRGGSREGRVAGLVWVERGSTRLGIRWTF